MKIVIKKTDKRMTGHEVWQYVAQPTQSLAGFKGVAQRMVDLHLMRDWCWQTYGPSCELTHWMATVANGLTPHNDHWCWHTDFDNYKIYLRTEKEANWFKLKWL
jgi:hypothetical protein